LGIQCVPPPSSPSSQCVPKSTSLCPICFAQRTSSWNLYRWVNIGTYMFLCLEHILQYWGESNVSEFYCDGPIKESHCKKSKLPPWLINMDHATRYVPQQVNVNEQVYWTFRLSKPLKLVACPNGPKNCPPHIKQKATLPLHDNETLPIINKPKHPKKGEYKEQNGRTHVQEDKRTT
jgi:hypothetical protein